MAKNKREPKGSREVKSSKRTKGFRNLKLTSNFTIISVLAIIFIIIVASFGIINTKRINNELVSMYDDKLIPITELNSIRTHMLNVTVLMNKAAIEYKDEYNESIERYDGKVRTIYNNLISSNLKHEDKKKVKDIVTKYRELVTLWDIYKGVLTQGNKAPQTYHDNIQSLSKQLEGVLFLLEQDKIAEAEELNKEGQRIYNSSLLLYLIIIFSAVIILSVLSLINKKLIKASLKEIIQNLDDMAKGDLTVKIDRSGTNEFSAMRRAVGETLDNVSTIIKIVKEKSGIIDSKSYNLAAVAEEMSSSTANISAAIQDVSKGIGFQAEDLVSITNVLNDFSIQVENIVKDIEGIDMSSREINSLAIGSNSSMQNLTLSVKNIENSFNELISKISKLGTNISKVTEITEIINNIADQTNLLALNAAIEAARAGEAGRGFAVVAEEIGHLAEQSKSSSEDINKLINGISLESATMTKSADEMNNELHGQTDVIEATIESFKTIVQAVEKVIPKINAAAKEAERINNDKDDIVNKIESASSVAEEVTASSQEISASTEEMNSSSEEVAASAEELNNMTKEMMDKVNLFKL